MATKHCGKRHLRSASTLSVRQLLALLMTVVGSIVVFHARPVWAEPAAKVPELPAARAAAPKAPHKATEARARPPACEPPPEGCPATLASLHVDGERPLVLERDGSLVLPGKDDEARNLSPTFVLSRAFFESQALPYVRITDGDKDLACGRVTKASQTYDLRRLVSPPEKVRIIVYAIPNKQEEYLWQPQSTLLLKSVTGARTEYLKQHDALTKELDALKPVARFPRAFAPLLEPPPGEDDLANPLSVYWALARLEYLSQVASKFIQLHPVPNPTEVSPLLRADLEQIASAKELTSSSLGGTCQNLAKELLEATRKRDVAQLQRVQGAIAPFSAFTNARASFLRELKQFEQSLASPDVRESAAAKLRALLPQLREQGAGLKSNSADARSTLEKVLAVPKATEDEAKAVEEKLDLLEEAEKWIRGKNYRPLSTFELPVKFEPITYMVEYGAGELSLRRGEPGERITLLVSKVPANQKVNLHRGTEKADVNAPNLDKLIKTFATMSVGVLKGMEAVPPGCERASANPWVVFDDLAVTPVYSARVVALSAMGAEKQKRVILSVCKGEECELPKDATSVQTIVPLATNSHWEGVTFLLDAGVNFLGRRAAYGPPEYIKVGAPQDGRQLYRLAYDDRNGIFSVSMLLGFRWRVCEQHLVAGFGPAFVPHNDSGIKWQVDGRIGWQPFSGFFLTGGVGLRRVAVPRISEIGETQSLPVGSAPSLDEDAKYFLVGALGVSIDLGTLGDSAAQLVDGISSASKGGS